MTGTRLRLTKGIALDKKDRKALREVNKALAKIGHDLNGPMTELEARELDFKLENDLVRTALYRHFDKDGNLLYLGVSLNAIERTISHRDKSPWYQDIARIEIEWHNSRSAAYYHEKRAIQYEHPRHNIKDQCQPSETSDGNDSAKSSCLAMSPPRSKPTSKQATKPATTVPKSAAIVC